MNKLLPTVTIFCLIIFVLKIINYNTLICNIQASVAKRLGKYRSASSINRRLLGSNKLSSSFNCCEAAHSMLFFREAVEPLKVDTWQNFFLVTNSYELVDKKDFKTSLLKKPLDFFIYIYYFEIA